MQSDLVLLSFVIDHLRNPTRDAEPHLHTDDTHHHDAALPWFLDVIDLAYVHLPRRPATDPEAVKSYSDQLRTHRIRTTSPLRMLMTPGVNGTTVITPATTITTILDPILLPIHHHGNHQPSHQPALQHHMALCPSDFLTATVKTLRLPTRFRSPSSTASDLRVRCLTELGPDHVVPLRQSLTPAILQLFNQFVDAMSEQLAQPYRTVNNHRIYIKASHATVRNIARAFAQSNLLDRPFTSSQRTF